MDVRHEVIKAGQKIYGSTYGGKKGKIYAGNQAGRAFVCVVIAHIGGESQRRHQAKDDICD